MKHPMNEPAIVNKMESFNVKESKGVNIIASIVFWIMFFSAVNYNEFEETTPRTSVRLFYITIVPAIVFLLKSVNKKSIIEINKTGFYFHGALVTNWDNYISVRYAQEEKVMSLTDNFVLFIDYYNQEKGMRYVSKIKMSNTQNKSEEEIIAAIEHFHTLSKN